MEIVVEVAPALLLLAYVRPGTGWKTRKSTVISSITVIIA